MAVLTNASDIHLYSVSSNFLSSTSPQSISCWIKNTWNGGSRISMVGMYDGTSTATPTTGVQIGTSSGAGEISTWTYGGTILATSATGIMNTYNGTWVHAAYTYDGTTHLIYVNGVQVATGTTTQIVGTFDQIWINGYPPTGNTAETSALGVDAYLYYNRTLSANEVLTIYNATGERHGIFNGVLAKYEFDELGQGSTVVSISDLSGNNQNLSVAGTGSAITYDYSTSFPDSNIRSPL